MQYQRQNLPLNQLRTHPLQYLPLRFESIIAYLLGLALHYSLVQIQSLPLLFFQDYDPTYLATKPHIDNMPCMNILNISLLNGGKL